MWHVFQSFRRHKVANAAAADHTEAGPIVELNPRELALLIAHASDRLMIFDLRHSGEVARQPAIIPDAFLTTNVDLFELMRWIPAETIVVFYAAEQIPRDCAIPVALSGETVTYVLKGGLRAWCEAGGPVDPVALHKEQAHSNS